MPQANVAPEPSKRFQMKDGKLIDTQENKEVEKKLYILHANVADANLEHALKSIIAYAFQPIIVPIMLAISWIWKKPVNFLEVRKTLQPGKGHNVPESMEHKTEKAN